MKNRWLTLILFVWTLSTYACAADIKDEFKNPPDSARPGVYWYFMDGNLSREGMTADLASMKEVGLGNLVFLEVNVGVPRGPVDFMSDSWQDLFAHAVHEAERLGIDITLGAGPGWTGSGGPWVEPEQAMQFLLSSVIEAKGPAKFDAVLPMPQQRPSPWGTMRTDFYEDVVVYAFPQCDPVIADVAEKALYQRYPYTSSPGVKAFLPAPAQFNEPGADQVISPASIVDVSKFMDAEGRLQWDVPAGDWTIVRMVRRATCASTRPAPEPGIGLECDKFDRAALDHHFANYYGKLLKRVGTRTDKNGWTAVHMDSWEMGSQNWTKEFLAEFKTRRGYDAAPYLPAYSGRAVGSLEQSERFLWDVRLTSQELVLENHAGHLKALGHQHGLELSIEPYDMNPCADLDLGAVADVPMCEFWSDGFGYDSSFSCIESTSIAHTMGRSIVSAEAFTADYGEKWQQYPWSMKNQGDWAFAMGINRFVYHTFAHKPLGDDYRPGMTMGGYGVHWDRGQTWWPMSGAYHEYVTRCSHLLRQGVTVSDVLYLTPEGAPHVFRAPASALEGKGMLADKKGYGFDGCSPNILMKRAEVREGRITFPGGTSYSLMILPDRDTMTPELLAAIERLVKSGAAVMGSPPVKSPSLTDYPACDHKVQELARKLWGSLETPAQITRRPYGKGCIYWGGSLALSSPASQEQPIFKSQWIWHPDEDAMAAAPVTRYFRRSIHVAKNKTLVSAVAEATADNSFTLSINGTQVLKGDNFHNIEEQEIGSALQAGENTLVISVVNGGEGANPAGLIAAVQLTYEDGTHAMIHTDGSWNASFNDTGDWKAARALGEAAMAPWSLTPQVAPIELYPHYNDTAAVLKQMKIPEDFLSNGPIRYAHRVTTEQDIYFVSNKSSESIQADCTFRVAGSSPQLWDPVTGQTRPLAQYTQENDLTTLPMEFAPYQSFFVIFPRKQSSKPAGLADAVNFPKTTPVKTLQGSWEVSFDPKWGGPENVTFAALEDWTAREERGIKYYSGIATYRKIFDCAQVSGLKSQVSAQRLYLDLGTVHDMARVTLNGKDLGVVWCAPWRVDVTEAVKPVGNVLEIDIANRWSNRLLGDQQTPDKDVRTVQWESGFLEGREYKTGRYTFSTTGGPGKLLPSGLIGPVRILVADLTPHSLAMDQVPIQSDQASTTIDAATVKQWSAPYRDWHYYPDHVIPAEPNITGYDNVKMTDVPTVFQVPGHETWGMTFIGFDGKGYQSFMAESDDLVNWTDRRLAMGYGPQGSFDYGGVVLGAFLYHSYDIKASRFLKKKQGKYYSLYGAYPRQGGYELRPGYEGLAFSEDGFIWQRAKDEPILSVYQPDCGTWEKDCIYQPWLVEYRGTYYDFYNAANGSIEQMGLALSEDLFEWKRYAHNPVIPHGPKGSYNERFSSDGKVFWDTDHWVNFFFGVGQGGAHVMAAFSRDLLHWTVDPEPLYKAGGNPSGLDKQYAHKISLVWNPDNETFYMFYNAVGKQGRGIGLITSKPLADPTENKRN